MKKIIFIDDEPDRIDDYLLALKIKFSYEIIFFGSPIEALCYILKNSKNINVIVLDIMMHSVFPGEFTGLDGGPRLYEKLKKDIAISIPIIILTNRQKEILQEFVKSVEDNGDYFCEKIKTRPVDLVDVIKKIIS